jgi:hypothetical protein
MRGNLDRLAEPGAAGFRAQLLDPLWIRVDKGRNNPLAHGICRSAFEAPGHRKLSCTERAGCLSQEAVEWLPATPALPVFPDRRCGLAARAGKSFVARQLCETRQGLRVSQPAPAIQKHEGSQRPKPDRTHPDSEHDEPGHAQEADAGGYHQAAGASEHKPKQRAKNLAAVQRVDWQHVEYQETQVDEFGRLQQSINIGMLPAERPA